MIEIFDAELEATEALEEEAEALAEFFGVSGWEIRVVRLKIGLPGVFATTDFHGDQRKAVVWLGLGSTLSLEVLAHEFAHIAIDKLSLGLESDAEERLAKWLAKIAVKEVCE
jgi:hypothetical protein